MIRSNGEEKRLNRCPELCQTISSSMKNLAKPAPGSRPEVN